MITVAEMQKLLQMTVKWRADQQDSAEQAIEWASARVMSYCGRTTWASPPTAVKTVVARMALVMFTNPQMRTSYQAENLSYQGGLVRLLTDEDRAILDNYRPRAVRVGSARMGVAAWMTPAPEET